MIGTTQNPKRLKSSQGKNETTTKREARARLKSTKSERERERERENHTLARTLVNNNGVDKLRDHRRRHRCRREFNAHGYSHEHVDVAKKRENDSKDDGGRVERRKRERGGEERRGGNREEVEEVKVETVVFLRENWNEREDDRLYQSAHTLIT